MNNRKENLMNINIEKAKEEFVNYTSKFNLNDDHIKRKQQHSLRVMEISKHIAEGLKLEQEEIELAALIGLLHDIARFEQYKQYQTFKDFQSFDHGDYALVILEKEIRKYIEIDEYDEIIKKAIKNHNKYKIEDGLSEKEMLFAKIIRDADKIDIFYESSEMFWKCEEIIVEKSKISKDVLEQFNKNEQVKKSKDIKLEPIEDIVFIIAFIFDINFKTSFEILKREDYINRTLNRYNIEDEFSRNAIIEIRKNANQYIEEKINK